MSALQGYQEFKNTTLPNIKEKLAKLEQGQAPHTFFITCSDSRICPNKMTNTDFGELFVVRNAGNSLPKASVQSGDADKATLEYAVKALGVKEIVVCGHSHCGAIGALMQGVDSKQLPHVASYLEKLKPLKDKAQKEDMKVERVIEENVRFQLENLLTYDFVREKVEAKELKLEGWVYEIESGNVKVVESYESLEG